VTSPSLYCKGGEQHASTFQGGGALVIVHRCSTYTIVRVRTLLLSLETLLMLASTLSSEMLQNLEAKLRQAICWPPSHSLLSPVRAQQLKRKAVHDALVPGQPQHSPAASPGLHQLSCLRKVQSS
jgi:hypothetical protein